MGRGSESGAGHHFGLGYEVALAAAAECWKALVGQRRADQIMYGVLGHGCGQGLTRFGEHGASFFFFELVLAIRGSSIARMVGVHWGVGFPSFPGMTR